MEDILDVSEKRELIILRTLYLEPQWRTVKDLATIANCSIHTAYKIIERLNSFSQEKNDLFNITSMKNKGVYLHSNSNYSLMSIESFFLEQSITYKLIDLAIQNQANSLKHLEEHFFLSRSTLYRRLKTIKGYLKKNGLDFDYTSMELNGEEHLVREFSFRFYWSLLNTQSWPFPSIEKEKIKKNVDNLVRIHHLKITELEKQQMVYRIAINSIRHSRKKYLTYSPDELLVEPMSPQILSKFNDLYATIPPEHVRWTEYQFLEFFLIANPSFEEKNSHNLKEKLIWHRESHSVPFRVTELLLNKVTELYHHEQELLNDEVISRFICSFQKNIAFLKLKINQNNLAVWLELFQRYNNDFFLSIQQIIKYVIRSFPTDLRDIDEKLMLYHCLLILSNKLDIQSLEEPLYIKIICKIEPLSESYLKQQIIMCTKIPLVIHTCTDNDDTSRVYDFLLADFPEKIDDLPAASHYYYWDFPITERDWREIELSLNKIHYDKKISNSFNRNSLLC